MRKNTIQFPQHLLVASGGGVHPFCLKWNRSFAITPPKSLLLYLGWGQCEQTWPQEMRLWAMAYPCPTQTEAIFPHSCWVWLFSWMCSSTPALFIAP